MSAGFRTRVSREPTDIFTETINQAVGHFGTACSRGNVSSVSQSMTLINQSIIECRMQTNQECEMFSTHIRGIDKISVMGLSRMRQWVLCLETLVVSALPRALRLLNSIHESALTVNTFRASPFRASPKEIQHCVLLLLNFAYFVLVAFRQLLNELFYIRKHLSSQQPHRLKDDPVMIKFIDGTANSIHQVRETCQVVDGLYRQMTATFVTMRRHFSDHFPLIVWHAEQQLWLINEQQAVRIKSYPSFVHLPTVPQYITEHDGWVWLLLCLTLHGMLPLEIRFVQQNAGNNNNAGQALNTSGAKSWSRQSSSPPQQQQHQQHHGHPRRTGSSSVLGYGTDETRYFPPSAADAPLLHSQSSESAETSSGLTNPPGTAHPTPVLPQQQPVSPPLDPLSISTVVAPSGRPQVRSGITELLLQLKSKRDSFVVIQKLVSVILSVFELFLKLWLKDRPLLSQFAQTWSGRGGHLRGEEPFITQTLIQLCREELTDTTTLYDLIRLCTTLDDLIINLPELFARSPRPLIRYLGLLNRLAVVQLFLTVGHLPVPEAETAVVGDVAAGPSASAQLLQQAHNGWSASPRARPTKLFEGEAVDHFLYVSKMLASRTAEYILEPSTRRTDVITVAEMLPQEYSSHVLQLALFFMAADFVLLSGKCVDWGPTLVRATSPASAGPGTFPDANKTSGGGGGSGTTGMGGGAAGADTTSAQPAIPMQNQWRWWSVWVNFGHYVRIRGVGATAEIDRLSASRGKANSVTVTETPQQRLWRRRQDSHYVQSVCLAMEELLSFLLMMRTVLYRFHAREMPRRPAAASSSPTVYPIFTVPASRGAAGGGAGSSHNHRGTSLSSASFATTHRDDMSAAGGGGGGAAAAPFAAPEEDSDAVDETASLFGRFVGRVFSDFFVRLRGFLARLHDEHLAAIDLKMLGQESAVGEEAYNALLQVLDTYVDAMMVPRHGGSGKASAAGGLSLTTMHNRAADAASLRGGPPGDGAGATAAGSGMGGGANVAEDPSEPSPRRIAEQFWELGVLYLRLSAVETTPPRAGVSRLGSGGGFQGVLDSAPVPVESSFVCASPSHSLLFLRDRSYECYADWVMKRYAAACAQEHTGTAGGGDAAGGAAAAPVAGAGAGESGAPGGLPSDAASSVAEAMTERFRASSSFSGRHTAQWWRSRPADTVETTSERLALASLRFVTHAVALSVRAAAAASGGTVGGTVGGGGGTTTAGRQQQQHSPFQVACTYADAYTRFLLGSDAVPCQRLLYCLHVVREELHRVQARYPPPQSPAWAGGSFADRGGGYDATAGVVTEIDVGDARVFDLELMLHTI